MRDAIFVTLGVLTGLSTGYYLTIRAFGDLPGFTTGVIWTGLISGLGALMAGYLLASLGEEFLGKRDGVLLGLFLGTLVGAALLSSIGGFIGVLVSRYFRD
jgi:hypothetical protein